MLYNPREAFPSVRHNKFRDCRTKRSTFPYQVGLQAHFTKYLNKPSLLLLVLRLGSGQMSIITNLGWHFREVEVGKVKVKYFKM